MTTMGSVWVWTEEDPVGGEGAIYAFIPAIGSGGTLQARRRDIAEKFRPLALRHQQRTGHKVRLVRFDRAVVVEEFGAGQEVETA